MWKLVAILLTALLTLAFSVRLLIQQNDCTNQGGIPVTSPLGQVDCAAKFKGQNV